ncbi:hypothetical protein [Coleofasciculus sp.]|uniref:hypothetical protein n=1 Tax=Coleofasciculus sp. TaxID=3100458 RepID=UPI003A38161D
MIISDLNHLEEVSEVPTVVGGTTTFDFLDVTYQQISVKQLGLSSAQAVSMFGDANALATAINIPQIEQINL